MWVLVGGGGKVHNVVKIEHKRRKINCAIYLCFSKRNTVYERLKRGLPRCWRSSPIQRKFAGVVRSQGLRSNPSFREVEASTGFLEMKQHGHTANTRCSSTVLFKKLDWIVNARTGAVDGGNEEINNYYSRDC